MGAGGSGLAAALAAAHEGAHVVVLEKRGSVGGTTSMAIGSVTASGTALQRRAGVVDAPEHHFEDLGLIAGDRAEDDHHLRKVLVENAAHTVDWLESLGVTFHGPMPEAPHRQPRMHNALPSAKALIHHLRRHCLRAGVDIRLDTRATGLIMSSGRVAGVEAETPNDRVRILARRGVILASGDFSGSRDLKQRFLPDITHVEAINANSTGDGHLMGEAVGGTFVNAHQCLGPHLRFVAPPRTWVGKLPQGRLLSKAVRGALEHAPQWALRPFVLSFVTTFLAPSPKLFEAGAILINIRGERFTDETGDPASDVGRQPGGSAFIVFDAEVAEAFERWPNYVSTAPGVAYAYLADYRRNRQDIFHESPTLEALGDSIAVPAERLARTAGDASLRKGPFYALGPLKAWIIVTDGGLAVSPDHQVLSGEGRPIAGLYAVGSVGQGGLQLGGHGHRLSWAFTSGRRAGVAAANADETPMRLAAA